uniref:Uncharacterized protein n=1 Tax=Opuntia streptacantha TaxID=393608 RepID=A0A7C9APB0_OPUST
MAFSSNSAFWGDKTVSQETLLISWRASSQPSTQRGALYNFKTSVVSLVASYHARRFTTCVISVRNSGRTKCFFPNEVRRRILANAGTTSLDRSALSSTTASMTTFMELPCLFTLSAAFRASNPPSSWPTSTTDENPISEQNARSRST